MAFRKTSGAILCPSCGRLTNAEAPVCLVCGRRNPGMWGFGGALSQLFRSWNFTNIVMAACVVAYVASLIFDPASMLRPRGGFEIFSPTSLALWALGMTSGASLAAGQWWTLITAIYLHGGLLHILFNMLWVWQLGPAVEELYGPSRLAVIFTVAGVVGFVVSDVVSGYPTIGASGSIFGLLGAMIAFGRKRGGVFGQMVLRQYGQWALVLFLFGFFMAGVNNWAHAGGFAGGYLSGLMLSLAEHRHETGFDKLLALGAIALTVVAFALAIWTALAR